MVLAKVRTYLPYRPQWQSQSEYAMVSLIRKSQRPPITLRFLESREQKYEALDSIEAFEDLEWRNCFAGWSKPFLPEGEGDYFSWPLLTDLFPWQHSGSQFKRTWPIGETPDLLEARWQALLSTTEHNRKVAFKESRDRNIDQTYASIEGSGRRLPPISSLGRGTSSIPTARYAFRSFDRQWAIPDPRLGDFLRPALWRAQSSRQIYLTTILSDVLGLGPAATVCSFVPDLHHFSGRGGKDAISLYRDAEATESNVTNNLLTIVADALGVEISAEDIFSYVYALLASSEYVDEFTEELTMPGPRVPITKTPSLFQRASELGRKLIWLHTYGARLIPEGEHILGTSRRDRHGVGRAFQQNILPIPKHFRTIRQPRPLPSAPGSSVQ